MHDRKPLLTATLPGAYYYDAAIYEREREHIWGEMWVCVERAELIWRAGDFVTVDVAGESLLIVRGRDQQLRAFFNVCRHRGARIKTESCGSAHALTCRYHAWTYGLDGALQGAPNIASFGDFPRHEFGLLAVAVAEYQGLVWVNLAAEPLSIDQQLAPALLERFGTLEQFERYNMGGLSLGKRLVYDVAANWKLITENFLECYHCGPMHPELCDLLPGFRNGGSYLAPAGTGTSFADNVGQFTLSGNGDRRRLPGLLDADDRLYFGLCLAPNVLLSLLPDHVIVHTTHPRGPERTTVICDWLFDPAVVTAPDFDPGDTVAIFDLVNRQDWEVCELTQLSMRSRAYARGGAFVPAEYDLAQFNALVRARVESDAQSVTSIVASEQL